MRPDEYIGAITRQTSVLLNSANWNWWAQNAARTAGVSLARSALPVFCACHSYPSPDAGAPVRETLRLSAAGISRIPDDDAADNTRPPPGLAAVPGLRTTWSCRCVCNRGSGFRSVPSSSEARVGYDPELEFGSFHPRTIRSPAPVDSDTDRPHQLVSPEMRIVRELKGFHPMRFQIMAAPDVVHRRLAHSQALGQQAATPLSLPLGF